MIIEICLVFLAITSITFVILLMRFLSEARKSIHLLQIDVHELSTEARGVLQHLNAFIQSDLHHVSEETTQLVRQWNDLSSTISHKMRYLDFLFKPLNFLSPKLSLDFSSEGSSKSETIPLILKWIVSSALLFKKTREYVKNYEKRT